MDQCKEIICETTASQLPSLLSPAPFSSPTIQASNHSILSSYSVSRETRQPMIPNIFTPHVSSSFLKRKSGNKNLISLTPDSLSGRRCLKALHQKTSQCRRRPMKPSDSMANFDIYEPLFNDLKKLLKKFPKPKITVVTKETVQNDRQNIDNDKNDYIHDEEQEEPILPDLINFYTRMSRPENYQSYPEVLKKEIEFFITENLFRIIPPLSNIFIENDNYYELCISSLKEVQILHKMTIFVISQNYRMEHQFKNYDFMRKLVRSLDTPDRNEQLSILTIISAYSTSFPENSEILFAEGMKQLECANEGIMPFFCINPTLLMIRKLITLAFFSNNHSNYKVSQIMLSLFLNRHLPTFFESLSSVLLSIYAKQNVMNLYEVFHFLLIHWPNSSFQKKILFLQHILIIFKKLDYDITEFDLSLFLQRIEECLQLNNLQVMTSLSTILSDATFFAHSEFVSSKIYEAIKETLQKEQKSSVESIVSAADTLLTRIDELKKNRIKAENHIIAKTKLETGNVSWTDVKRIAEENGL